MALKKKRKKRDNKFNAVTSFVDGLKFHSKAEAARYVKLKEMLKAGEIYDLELQPDFRFELNGIPMRYIGTPQRKGKEITYIADFAYCKNGKWIVEDVKGMQTDVFKLKRALMLAINGIDVRVVK